MAEGALPVNTFDIVCLTSEVDVGKLATFCLNGTISILNLSQSTAAVVIEG